MKLQNLSIIFAIIIIPVTLILSAYIGSQIDTASLQQSYDTTLMDATHDAVVAFELNTSNNAYSNNADSIRRDIQASINTFTTSLANGLNVPGANSEYIMPYIPAILITLYDGYYIYSPSQYSYTTKEQNADDGTWKEEQKTGYKHVLKPYIYYSAKYKKNDSNYVVVNYSLDNYITVYGVIDGKVVSKSGYLGTKNLDYISEEGLSEKIVYRTKNSDNTYSYYNVDNCKFVYNNGKKIYKIRNDWYYLNDLDIVKSDAPESEQDQSANIYKTQAEKFNKWITDSGILSIVTPENAIKIGTENEKYEEFMGENKDKTILDTDPEDPASRFNQHKREIIKLSIQDNLNNAMAIYNANSGAMGTNATFAMPKLSEQDWDKILNNVNFVTFMQGLPVGNKIYNSYSIVSSSNNKQYIRPDSIYMIENGEYHTVNCVKKSNNNNLIGYKSSDFTKLKYEENDSYKYYYRRPEYACYKCIVDYSNNAEFDLSDATDTVKKAYYTALARERYNLDKVTKKLINYEDQTEDITE